MSNTYNNQIILKEYDYSIRKVLPFPSGIFYKNDGLLENITDVSGWNMHSYGSETSQFVRYNVGYYYSWHRDSSPYREKVNGINTHERVISCSILLNDDFEGGEFQIKENKDGDSTTVDMESGDIVIFKSNLYHQITKVTDGFRKSIVTWFRKH